MKHTGENEGVGVVSWDAESVARFKDRTLGKRSLSLQVVEFVRQNASLDESTQKNLETIPITNIDRLVSDPKVREALGISVQKGELETILPKDQVLMGLTKIVKDVANKEITVNNIRSKDDRQDYLNQFGTNDLPSRNTVPVPTWKLQSLGNLPQLPGRPTRRSMPLSTNRKTLIPQRCILKIAQPRINKMYKELRLLDVDKFPNSTAVMLRVFVELSIDDYMSRKHISLTGRETLANKMSSVANYFEKNKMMDKQELKSIRVAVNIPDALFSTNTLNAYVHNKNFAPKPSELKTTWDNMESFVQKIWE